MSYCPNCGQPIEGQRHVCPFCGFEQPPLPALGSGPPQAGKLLTRRAWLDTTIGVLGAVVSPFVYCVGLIVALALYFALRQRYPAVSRGLGYGLLTVGAVFLAVLAIFLASIVQGTF